LVRGLSEKLLLARIAALANLAVIPVSLEILLTTNAASFFPSILRFCLLAR
jgi:hypothetical protein